MSVTQFAVFTKHIFNGHALATSSRVAIMRCSGNFDFAPTLDIRFLLAGQTIPMTLVDIVWDAGSIEFRCRAMNEFKFTNKLDDYDFDELVAAAVADGWEQIAVRDFDHAKDQLSPLALRLS